MNKIITTLGCTLLMCLSTVAQAKQTSPVQMQENFNACTAGSPYWTQRWGQYVISFDTNAANDICTKKHGFDGFQLGVARCQLGGKSLDAGFYCGEKMQGGDHGNDSGSGGSSGGGEAPGTGGEAPGGGTEPGAGGF